MVRPKESLVSRKPSKPKRRKRSLLGSL